MYKKRYLVDVFRPISAPNQKKGQVTVFIILGILMLLALIIIIFLKSEVVTFNPDEIIPTEKSKVENFITNCIESIGEDALFLLGLQAGYIEVPKEIEQDNSVNLRISPMNVVPLWAYGKTVKIPDLLEIKDRVDDYLEENIRSCLFNLNAFQETYNLIEKSGITADTEIVKSKVIFNVKWNLEIRNKGGDIITEVIDHVAESNIKLKDVYEVSRRIVEKELSSLKLEDITQDLIALEHPDVPVAGMELRCDKKVWDVNQVRESFLELLRVNIGELKIRGTNYIEFPEELTYYQNHYVWDVGENFDYPRVSTKFNFDSSYPYTFAVTPITGSRMQSSQLGGYDVLSLLCIQSWKFTYDMVYPVLVKVRDETTGFIFNTAFTVHLVRNVPSRDQVVSRPSYSLNTVNDDDYCEVMETPMTVFSYGLVDNPYTGVYNREPLEDVNTSFTCLRYRCEMLQTEYDFAGLGHVAAYATNFPYCAGGILRGLKSGYKEDWVRVVTETGKEVELELEPVFEFTADKIKIVKHEYKDSLNIGSSDRLDSGEVALIKINFRRPDDLEEPHHESSAVKSKDAAEEVFQREHLEFLAKADFGYELEINVLKDEKFVGGYKGNWTVSWEELENAEEIIFHVASRENVQEDQMFELMLGLDEISTYIQKPEIK
jgi:hypothetical protein